ncbi:Glycosyl hydrolases family 2 [Halovenus aranensis]|uniref:Glycosyl hydrolases family 2 n=1 Tax=Halovenus aranensis TaxID=890420 RepID=A0A1G8RR78_9EURY|nr:hydrolase [Halovenus aranensis]SDJ19005.1 Glycosyl hydrolases family 2 [Halovenus aranensis]
MFWDINDSLEVDVVADAAGLSTAPVTDMTTANGERHMLEEWQASALDGGRSGSHTVSVPGKPAQLAGSDAVKYKTQFTDPRDPDDDVAVLELRGLYAQAEVHVTGERIGGNGPVSHDAYFDPCRVAFDPYEDNEVVVTCRRPQDRFGGIHDTDSLHEQARVPGIWWGATLEGRPLPYIEDLSVRPELTDAGARLHVTATVVSDEALSDRITYSLRPAGDSRRSGMMDRERVETAGPGRERVHHAVEVRDPARWWPRELGEQNRYTLRAKLGDSERTVTTGICEIAREGGALRVNGERVPIRGVNLTGGTEADVDRACELNATVVRAHASVLPPACYERCDREGLLVWQDLPLTGPGAFDVDRGQSLARTLARRRAQNPSVAVYTVHDDPVEPFTDGLGTGTLDSLRLRWRAWRSNYDRSAADRVAEELPEDRPVVPVVGPPGTGADAGSYYPGWDYGEPSDIGALLDRYPTDVVAEFGAGALAEAVGDAAGFDAAKHERHAEGVTESQAYQASLLRTIIERLRIADVGALAFTLRDTDRAGMGVYAADGDAKAAADAVENALRPLQAFLADTSPGESEVVVVNDLPKSFDISLSWTAGDESGEFDLTVEGGNHWRGGAVAVPNEGTVGLTMEVGDHRIENEYDV